MSKRKVIVFVVLAIFIGGWIARESLLRSAASWLDIGSPPGETDYVFVLNGDLNVRPFIGAAVVSAGFAPSVLLVPVSEPPKSPTDATPAHHEIARLVLIQQGVAPSQIKVIDGNCASTFDEARSLRKYLAETGQDQATVSIVTSDYHTRRTRWIFRQVFGATSERLHYIAAPTDGFGAHNWWRVEVGFMTYGTEFLKFGFYQFRYGKGLPIAAGAAAIVVASVLWLRCKRSTAAEETAVV